MSATLACWNAKPLNSAAIGRELEVSRTAASIYVRALEQEGLLRLIPFYGRGKKPLLSLTNSARGRWIESIVKRICQEVPDARFSWWKTGRVRQVDLIADLGRERIGFCFLESPIPQPRHWLGLDKAGRRGIIHRGFLLHDGFHCFVKARIVVALPVDAFMRELDQWIFQRSNRGSVHEALRRINEELLARATWLR